MELPFPNLRGVRWRINLGILPRSPSASIEDLRRVAADSRRRYASMRRHLLIDPHFPKDGSRSPDLVQDNPLSQNPDSLWGRFFRNAELEKMVEQDLSRLYPEHGSYFRTPACQAMLRRILLLWCVRHPEYGYRQGMHELLAPLLYVLHVDLHHLSQVQGQYTDYFTDEFDDTSFPERDLDDMFFQGSTAKVGSLDDLDPDTRDIFLLSDAYGAEGELGIILSERFMEHDAYCMFDSLMNGARGVVAMADFFSPTPAKESVPPVIEASSALYHLLAIVDSSLHSHLVELGVEPQYFALRWLRVLFGREFSLDDLLVIWDELFSFPNNACIEDGTDSSFRIFCSPRGAFITSMAVSMLLHVRSSLFATENATSCLQRLLNFPKNIDVQKLIEKARSLQALALDSNTPLSSFQGSSHKGKPALGKVYSLPSGSVSPKTPPYPVPDSYWEEKWSVLHKEEALKKGSVEKNSVLKTKGSLVERFGLSRTESAPASGEGTRGENDSQASVRRSLLDNLSREVDSGSALGKQECNRDGGKHCPDESDCGAEETCLSGENSSDFSTATSLHSTANDDENGSEKSSVTSNSSVADNDEDITRVEEERSLLQDLETASTSTPRPEMDEAVKQETASKEPSKPFYGKFQWFFKFGRGSGEGNTEKGGFVDRQVLSDAGSSTLNCNSSKEGGRTEVGDKKVVGSLKNLGQSMLENIQVIDSVLQQDYSQSGNSLGGKEQVAAVSALTELRKISNILYEM